MRRAALLVLLLALAMPAFAVEPDEMLADPALETRAREIGRDLRCLVCQNESIEDSDADLARDLRLLVRERLLAGDSDEQVIDYIAARYGDFVRLDPPVKPATWLLWFGPALLLMGAGFGTMRYLRQRDRLAAPAPLSDEERDRVAQLLKARHGDEMADEAGRQARP